MLRPIQTGLIAKATIEQLEMVDEWLPVEIIRKNKVGNALGNFGVDDPGFQLEA
tara:strand:- start:314 stop:475 length:162 start_codon:yes stop_codon:yes gene_type:complete